MFQAYEESIRRKYQPGTRSELPFSRSPGIIPQTSFEYKNLVFQNKKPFKRDFRGYLYIQVVFPTNFTSLKFQVYIPNKSTKCTKTYRHIISETVYHILHYISLACCDSPLIYYHFLFFTTKLVFDIQCFWFLDFIMFLYFSIFYCYCIFLKIKYVQLSISP